MSGTTEIEGENRKAFSVFLSVSTYAKGLQKEAIPFEGCCNST